MNAVPLPLNPPTRYTLRFEPLASGLRTLSFPCDEAGHVLLDELSEPAKRLYLYARVVLGREFAAPSVVVSGNR